MLGKSVYDRLRTKRFRLFTGPSCNARCQFCYYVKFLSRKTNPSTDFLKGELLWAKRLGATAVDFSGGEPTVRADLPDLIEYAKVLDYKTIAIITNGILTSRKAYLDKLVDRGLNDILVSIHSHNSELHDTLVDVPGAFEKALGTLRNAKSSGLRLRTNTTVIVRNMQFLPRLGSLLARYEPFAVNFILFNDWYSPEEQLQLMPSFEIVSRYIKEAIDQIVGIVPKISVRYIPYCFMEGYEKYVCDFPQVPYDPDEWAPEIQLFSPEFGVFAPHDRITVKLCGERLIAHFLLSIKIRKIIDSRWLKVVQSGFFKLAECQMCAFNKMCDGIKKGYEKLYPNFKVYPLQGLIIEDLMEFRGPYLLKLYEK